VALEIRLRGGRSGVSVLSVEVPANAKVDDVVALVAERTGQEVAALKRRGTFLLPGSPLLGGAPGARPGAKVGVVLSAVLGSACRSTATARGAQDEEHMARVGLRLFVLSATRTFPTVAGAKTDGRGPDENARVADLGAPMIGAPMIGVGLTLPTGDRAVVGARASARRRLVAAGRGRLVQRIARFLPNRRLRRRTEALLGAARRGETARVRRWIEEAGMDPNAEELSTGLTALHSAAMALDPSEGAPSEGAPSDGAGLSPDGGPETRSAHEATIRVLLRAKALPNARDRAGRNLLHCALDPTTGQRDDCCVALLAALTRMAEDGETLTAGSLRAVVNARDARGQTPLHYARLGDRPLSARALIEAGADRGIRDVDGRTAQDCCEELARHRSNIVLKR
jgi:hypothetical protein